MFQSQGTGITTDLTVMWVRSHRQILDECGFTKDLLKAIAELSEDYGGSLYGAGHAALNQIGPGLYDKVRPHIVAQGRHKQVSKADFVARLRRWFYYEGVDEFRRLLPRLEPDMVEPVRTEQPQQAAATA